MKEENRKKTFKSDIKFLKSVGHKELSIVYTNALDAYLKSLITFGFNNPYTKECFKVVKEMKQVINEEKRILNLLKDHIDWINPDDLAKMIDIIDELDENAYLDYSDILDNIYSACVAKDKERIVRKKRIDSFISNDRYKEKVYTLIQKGTLSK